MFAKRWNGGPIMSNPNKSIVVPCIDIQGGEVVQLVQGRKRALVGPEPLEMIRRFEGFPEIQVIDLDAAMGKADNAKIIEMLASRAVCRVGGGVRSPERAKQLVEMGAHRVIVGTAAFRPNFSNIVETVGKDRVIVALDSKAGSVVVDGWDTSLDASAEDILPSFIDRCNGFLCTYVDKEGMMQGTDLDWFARLRSLTSLPVTAAGGITTLQDVAALLALNIDAAVGMAVYTGALPLSRLRELSV
jgi:phosphoribosylformimino-5-aminoimidazole carboxamide ribotide isomerase